MLERAYPLFTTVLTYDDGQEGEDEESSLPPHLGGYGGSKLPPGILPHGLPQVKEVQPAITALEQEQKKEDVKESKWNNCFFFQIWQHGMLISDVRQCRYQNGGTSALETNYYLLTDD